MLRLPEPRLRRGESKDDSAAGDRADFRRRYYARLNLVNQLAGPYGEDGSSQQAPREVARTNAPPRSVSAGQVRSSAGLQRWRMHVDQWAVPIFASVTTLYTS